MTSGQRSDESGGTERGSLWTTHRWHLGVLFFVVLGISLLNASGHSYAIDNEAQFQTTRSLAQLKAGLESVDSGWVVQQGGPYRTVDGEYVSIVGVGQSVISLPAYYGARVAAFVLPEAERDQFIRVGVFFTNSVLHAAAAVVVAMLAFELWAMASSALFLGGSYAFGTYAFPHAKSYFTETGAGLFVALGVLLLIRATRTRSPALFAGSGAAFAFAVAIRPSAGLFLPIAGVAVAWLAQHRWGVRRAIPYVVWFGCAATGVMALFALSNWWRFGSPLDLGYQTVKQSHPLVSGLGKQLFSPGKSYFLYAPIALLAPVGFLLGVRKKPFENLLLGAIIAANFVFFARVPFWSGDAAFGPRYALIVLPCVVPLVAPALRSHGVRAVAVALTGFGVAVAILGSLVYYNVHFAHAIRVLGPDATEAIQMQMSWNQILGQVEVLPEAVRDTFGWERVADGLERPPYLDDSSSHYGFFATEPRLDFWWLWVGPTRGSGLTYVYFVLPAAAFAAAVALNRRRVRSRVEDDLERQQVNGSHLVSEGP